MTKRTLTFVEFATAQEALNEYTTPMWQQVLTANHFRTAMFDEFAELLNSSNWKWWKKQDQHDSWNLKVEVIDIFHFALSIFILDAQHLLKHEHVFCECGKGHNYMVSESGNIFHDVFINKAVKLLSEPTTTAMDDLFDSLGMNAEEISALYIAKSQLNFFRQSTGYKDGTYVKIQDGIEDNVKLKHLVEGFLEMKEMSLDDLSGLVKESFFKNNEQTKET